MIVSEGSSGKFPPAPDGIHESVCVDVIDMGMIEVTYNGTTSKAHKVRLVWEIAETFTDEKTGKDRRFLVFARYTASLHEKSNLRKILKGWRGRDFTAEELRGFDLENVLGAPCKLVIEHNEAGGKTYANVAHIIKADKATALKPSGEYIRVKDRPPKGGSSGGGNSDPSKPGDDDLERFLETVPQDDSETIPF